MKNLNENELFERLRCPWKDQKITHEQITSPDYEVWGRAREWEYHQAVCLFSGMVPLSKPYFDILISNRSPLDIVHWLAYYPFKSQDQTRIVNIDHILQTLIPNTKQMIQPQILLAQCKSHVRMEQSIPVALTTVIEQFGAHPSLNLPNVFKSLELNPSTFINSSKLKKNQEKIRLATPSQNNFPSPPPLPPKPVEPPLSVGKRLFPLKISERWKEADGFSFNEAILLHYDIDPEGIYQSHLPGEPLNEQEKEFIEYLNRHFYGDRQLLISHIDEKKITDLLQRSIHLANLKISHHGILSKTDVIEWMKSKNLSFPIQELKNQKISTPGQEEDIKRTILDYDMARFRPEQHGRLLCRITAASLWKADKKLSLPAIQKHPLFKKTVSIAQEIMGKTDAIDPKTIEDWIRDLNPNYNPKK